MIILIYKFIFTELYFFELMLIFFLNLIIINCILSFYASNPIYSLLFLIVNYIIAGILFLINNYIFLGLIFILIYVGAVSILLLFTLMLLNLKFIYYKNFNKKYIFMFFSLIIILEFLFLIAINYNLISYESSYNFNWFEIFNKKNDLLFISIELYENYFILIFIISLFLLMSLLASVNIVNSLKNSKKQEAYIQLKRYSKNFIN